MVREKYDEFSKPLESKIKILVEKLLNEYQPRNIILDKRVALYDR